MRVGFGHDAGHRLGQTTVYRGKRHVFDWFVSTPSPPPTSTRTRTPAKVDRMLDEDLLVGSGRQACDTLRPLAYSTLTDLVHHVKDRIDLDQVSRVVQVCLHRCRCL